MVAVAVVQADHLLDLVSFVPVVRSQEDNKMVMEVEHSLELVADKDLALAAEVVALEIPGTPVRCTVLRTGGNRPGLVSKKRHNCGKYDTVTS